MLKHVCISAVMMSSYLVMYLLYLITNMKLLIHSSSVFFSRVHFQGARRSSGDGGQRHLQPGTEGQAVPAALGQVLVNSPQIGCECRADGCSHVNLI